jgi:integrase/recombinase XerD
MSLGKQAKVLSADQINHAINLLGRGSVTKNSLRNQVILLLSLHGLRACEIADLELSMILAPDGNVADSISLEDKASKGSSGGRIIPMSHTLREAIKKYLSVRKRKSSPYLITTQRADKFSPNAVAVWFWRFYEKMGLQGCSSHSGRRTFLTNAARRISLAGGSIRDVMALAGHQHLSTTQRYVEADSEAQRKVVAMIFSE